MCFTFVLMGTNSNVLAHDHSHDHDHDHGHNNGGQASGWAAHRLLLMALFILLVMQVLELGFQITFHTSISLAIYGTAFLLSGYQVLNLAFKKALRLDFFNEFFLMSVATIGAFAIGSYSEGVAVMVFYSIGEWFQDAAVDKAKRNIKALLDIRPDRVDVLRNGSVSMVKPETVQIGENIQVKPGERVALDGKLRSVHATFNTAALTGESIPVSKHNGAAVLAGMINLKQLAIIEVGAAFKDSKLSKILEMVQDATARKSRTQLFISRFAKIYTPIVFLLALLVVTLPYFLVDDYTFRDWLYRGLVFLVISCPCALVVSIPLGYFGGIGLASKNGILFKGANFLDVMSKVDTVVLDKTGTLTKGIFAVQKVTCQGMSEATLMRFVKAIERKSSHPIALAIAAYADDGTQPPVVADVEEIAGYGLKGTVDGKDVLAGNLKLLRKFNISYERDLEDIDDTVVAVAIDGKYAGQITIADEIKEDARQAVEALKARNIQVVMLSGDKQRVVAKVADVLGIDTYYGDLLPEAKVQHLEQFRTAGKRIAFVGDGVNDAPVIALADAGIAMGGLGSDAAIETADIVIQNDQPSKVATAINIGYLTRRIVWQNIAMALLVKVLVLLLGAGGLATLWEAVIADVGVALLAILNAVRIQRMKV
jgi:Cd2+/Zn2+-exporting ATPase